MRGVLYRRHMSRSAAGCRAAVNRVGTTVGVVALLLAMALALALAGCVPDAPVATPAPSPTSTPVFASDEEALAAAEEAYRAYLAVSDQIGNEGGADPERIADVVTGELLAVETDGFETFAANRWRTTGSTILRSLMEQRVDLSGSPTVVAYVCVDVTAVDVLDSSGQSLVAPSRPGLQPFVVGFDPSDDGLKPSTREPWEGPDLCEPLL